METGHLKNDSEVITALKCSFLDEKFLSLILRYRNMVVKKDLDDLNDKEFSVID